VGRAARKRNSREAQVAAADEEKAVVAAVEEEAVVGGAVMAAAGKVIATAAGSWAIRPGTARPRTQRREKKNRPLRPKRRRRNLSCSLSSSPWRRLRTGELRRRCGSRWQRCRSRWWRSRRRLCWWGYPSPHRRRRPGASGRRGGQAATVHRGCARRCEGGGTSRRTKGICSTQ
jgi:hypothetical protein